MVGEDDILEANVTSAPDESKFHNLRLILEQTLNGLRTEDQ